MTLQYVSRLSELPADGLFKAFTHASLLNLPCGQNCLGLELQKILGSAICLEGVLAEVTSSG